MAQDRGVETRWRGRGSEVGVMVVEGMVVEGMDSERDEKMRAGGGGGGRKKGGGGGC